MVCERCNKKKAVVYYRENTNGRIRARRLCQECAEILEQAGELEDSGTAIAGFLSPFFKWEDAPFVLPLPDGDPAVKVEACGGCGLTRKELSDTGKLGCAACYTAFPVELSSLIRSSVGSAPYRGRVSAGFRRKQERAQRVAALRAQLREAVSAENFESAVELRDAIRKLEAEEGGGVDHGVV